MDIVSTVATHSGVPGHTPIAHSQLHTPERIALVVLDAFGWQFVKRHQDHPLMKRIKPVAVKTQFPSTTTVHMTTLYSGCPVGEHGLYEWTIADSNQDPITVFHPLLAKTRTGEAYDVKPHLPPDMFTPSLGKEARLIQPKNIIDTPYSRLIAHDYQRIGYSSLGEGVDIMMQGLADIDGPRYQMLYYPGIDSVGHQYGPSSRQFDEEINQTLDTIDVGLQHIPKDTAVLFCADHGQIDVHATDFLDELWPPLLDELRCSVVGSARDCFLHVHDRDRVYYHLQEVIGDRARVMYVDQMVEQGFFGAVKPALYQRLADICVLPADGRMSWVAHSDNGIQAGFRGHHGGIHPHENTTFFGAVSA